MGDGGAGNPGDGRIERHRRRHLPCAGGTGARLAIHARNNREGAERAAAAARARGAEAVVLLADLALPGAAEGLVARAAEALGGLDVVVSNAGFADRTPVAALTDEGFARTQDTVLWAMLRLARAAGPLLARAMRRASSPSPPSWRIASARMRPCSPPPPPPRPGWRHL
ncbi:SDR family oxidoreductase [Pseudoroseomonas wenyumeiae]